MKNNRPRVSIIIPTYQRPECLKQCLVAITEIDYPRDEFEVIIVDDGGSIQLDSMVDLFSEKIDLLLLKQDHAGPAEARNRGVQQAKGEFVVFTDDDCLASPDWLTALTGFLARKPDCMVGGEVINGLPKNLFSSASQVLISSLYSYHNQNPDRAYFFTANNIALSKKCFLAVGGFDHKWGRAAAEDREFCDRWFFKGYQMIYIPEAVIYHVHALNLTGFWNQHFNYGRGAYYFHQVRFQRKRGKFKIEPLSFYLDLIQYPFSEFGRLRAFVISMLIMMAQAANGAGYFCEKFVQFFGNELRNGETKG